MTTTRAAFGLCLSLVFCSAAAAANEAAPSSPPAITEPRADDLDGIDQTARDGYAKGDFTFCKDPARPLGMRQRALCPLAADIPGCEGFVEACALEKPPDLGWLTRFLTAAAPVFRILLYAAIFAVAVAFVVPIVASLLKRRRKRATRERPEVAHHVVAHPDETDALIEISDAELALRTADEHRQRGELKKALGLYLAAALASLDRRGAIRIARYRTNGEYVRACGEDTSRPALREIVREVDRVAFGGESPSEASLLRVSSAAAAIVRAVGTALVLLVFGFFGTGCAQLRKGADPAGTELPTSVLERNGYAVHSLATSLGTMPIPAPGEVTPVVIVDTEKVPLEEETRAHLMRWVEAGGRLVVLGVGTHGGWPTKPRTETVDADTTELVVRTGHDSDADEDDDSDEANATATPLTVTGARTARSDALVWDEESNAVPAETIASLGTKIYASKRHLGKGILLAVANDDLLTNVGMMPRRNAAALLAIVRAASREPSQSNAKAGREIRVARAEDGISPPSNPFSALLAAGLGKGVWHALFAALLLFAAYGVRRTRARVDSHSSRRTFTEHVVAMGAFYERAHAHSHALSAYGRFVELSLREALPRGTDPVAFLAAQSGRPPERVAKLYARALTTKPDDEPQGDELGAMEELREMLEKALSARSR